MVRTIFLVLLVGLVSCKDVEKRSPKGSWEINPQVGKDVNGNTNVEVGIKRSGEKHDIEAGWNKVVKGPGKSKPTWHLGGTIRSKRSPKGPWEVSPQVGNDDNGNTNVGVGIKRTGEKHEIEAGWNKVVRGPGKGKPTWHIKGTIKI